MYIISNKVFNAILRILADYIRFSAIIDKDSVKGLNERRKAMLLMIALKKVKKKDNGQRLDD